MNLGFCGLGDMGQGIVPRLLAAGHTVTGWNRSKEKAEPLMKLGMKWADTPAAVAKASDIVFSIVTDSKAVKAVATGPDGIIHGLAKGAIYLDMSTIAPDASREISKAFADKGLVMLDAPLSGSPITLAAAIARLAQSMTTIRSVRRTRG